MPKNEIVNKHFNEKYKSCQFHFFKRCVPSTVCRPVHSARPVPEPAHPRASWLVATHLQRLAPVLGPALPAEEVPGSGAGDQVQYCAERHRR